VGVSRDAQNFWVPLSQERVKLRTSSFVGTFIGSIGTNAHEKMLGIIAVGVVRESRKYSRHPCIGLWRMGPLRGHLCDSISFLLIFSLHCV